MDTAKKVFAIVGNTNSICAKALGGTIIVILQSDYYLFVLLEEGLERRGEGEESGEKDRKKNRNILRDPWYIQWDIHCRLLKPYICFLQYFHYIHIPFIECKLGLTLHCHSH